MSLACCPEMSSTSCSWKVGSLQDDEVGSAMTEELTSSNGSKRQKAEAVSFVDWRSAETKSGLERLESGLSVVSAPDDDSGGGDELRRYSILDQGKLPSSQYKGVVPQPNGRWGAQIYERHQRVWLGTFNREEDAARVYDRAALKFRGRDAITNFRAVGDAESEARFMRQHSKGEIVEMLRKHTYDEELDQHTNNTKPTNIDAGDRQEIEAASPVSNPINGRPANLSSHLDINPPCSSSLSPHREHLFDKAVTPSDVGKLNRLVIPKQHAEKHFPLDVNSSDKGLLLNFEDDTGKAWRFRYSYWNSSQSYVLTKGWSRFVKDKRLEAGDVVSFHRGTPDTHQLYITWRRRPCGDQQPVQTKENVSIFPLGALNPFHSAQHEAAYNPQWMHIYWPNSESPRGHMDATVWPPHSPAIPLYRHPCLNINRPGAVDGPAKKESPISFDPSTKAKEVRIFGVNLVECQRLGELINRNRAQSPVEKAKF
ncbi:hypothetical protein KI387_005272 [Taxus chinensis]|uniref:Uncharacterized protein n=1 Tax=Taxus chinensis TaxID=29808 RepID=A0AA38GMJ6_TAXCH|nr:hypothetical protein KI387_005272 [Taxus chinensis]